MNLRELKEKKRFIVRFEDLRKVYENFGNEKSTALGLQLPLRRGSNGVFEKIYEVREQIKSNLKNLLLTMKGERLFNPDYGSDLIKLTFENLSKSEAEERAIEYIEEACKNWMPYIKIISAEAIDYEWNIEKNVLLLEVKYTYENAESLTDVVQLNVGGSVGR